MTKTPTMKTTLVSVILIIGLSFSSHLKAQITFQKTYGGSEEDAGYYCQQTRDGGYILTGSTDSFGVGSRDVYLIKTDSLGDTLWTRIFGEQCSDGYYVRQTTDGGYVIAGAADAFGLHGIFIIRTDSIGHIKWTKKVGGPGNIYPGSVQQTNEGGFIFAATQNAYPDHISLTTTSALGDSLWTKTYDGNLCDVDVSVQQTNDGGFIIAGNAIKYIAGDIHRDFYLIKTDIDGNSVWTKTIGRPFDNICHSVQQTSDSGYIIVGGSATSYLGYSDVYLVKTNPMGDTLWTKIYSGSVDDVGYYVQQTHDGGYIITGTSCCYGGGGERAINLIRTNNAGDLIWTNIYTVRSGSYCYGYYVQQTSDRGFVITGGSLLSDTDVCLIKTDSTGYALTVGVNEMKAQPAEITISPNPFNVHATFVLKNFKTGKLNLTIYNTLGESIRKIADCSDGRIRIERNNLANGLYFFTLTNDTSIIGNGKFVIE